MQPGAGRIGGAGYNGEQRQPCRIVGVLYELTDQGGREEQAAAGREQLLSRLRAESQHAPKIDLPPLIDEELEEALRAQRSHAPAQRGAVVFRRFHMMRTWSAAAAAIVLAAVLPLIMLNHGGGAGPALTGPRGSGSARIQPAKFDGYIMAPDAGRLDAQDDEGNLLGPCALKHTDVEVDVSGFYRSHERP